MNNNVTRKNVEEIFLKFFESKDHRRIKNSSIMPVNDSSLLFINSGMAPIKSYFLEEAQPEYPRLTNSQTCIRTNDLESVGDSHHGTSFNMLGNWSFGDYFKEEALSWALELVQQLEFPLERLYVTVFKNTGNDPVPDDNDSYKVWKKLLPAEEHIKWAPVEDNWWSCGPVGPCGPCSEIFFDRGPEYATGPADEAGLIPGQHIEIWNGGVFMTYNRLVDGSLEGLPALCVDSGAGLERITMILQGVESIHELKEFRPVFDQILQQTNDVRWSRIIFDHLKTSLFMLSAGIYPSNKMQGYVLRRLIRRMCCGYLKGLRLDSLLQLAEELALILDVPLTSSMKNLFKSEIQKFSTVINSQRNIKALDQIIAMETIDAEKVFNLFSTNGVPIELIKEKAIEAGKIYPEEKVELLLTEHRAKS